MAMFSTIKATLNELLEPNDFKISTWMAMGAGLLLLCQLYLPSSFSSLLPLSYLTYRFLKMVFETFRLHNSSYTTMMRGRWTATLSEPEDSVNVNSGSDGIVIFVLGARINQSVSPSVSPCNSHDLLAKADLPQPFWQTFARCRSHRRGVPRYVARSRSKSHRVGL